MIVVNPSSITFHPRDLSQGSISESLLVVDSAAGDTSPAADAPPLFNIIIEIPKGATAKLEVQKGETKPSQDAHNQQAHSTFLAVARALSEGQYYSRPRDAQH